MSLIPQVSLGKLLTLERRPVELIPDELYPEIGTYSFGRGIFHKTPRTGAEVGDKKLFMIKEGDFILQITFAWEGAVALASKAEDGMYGSVRFLTFRVDESRCFPPYLVYYFRTRGGLDQLGKISPGSAGRNRVLSVKRIPEVFVPLPKIEEQRCIVARIEELSAKIEEARRLREEALNPQDTLWVSGARSVLNKFRSDYSRPLRELVEVRGGGTPSTSNPIFWTGSIPWVCPRDMKSLEIRDSVDHISDEAIRNSPAKMLEPGAVLIVVRGMILVHTVPVGVLRMKATINQDMKGLVPRDGLIPEYLSAVLWAFNEDLLALVERSTHDTRKLETPKLLNFPIPIPTLAEQHRIVAHLDALQAKLDVVKKLQEETQEGLNALMPSILSKAFAGEL